MIGGGPAGPRRGDRDARAPAQSTRARRRSAAARRQPARRSAHRARRRRGARGAAARRRGRRVLARSTAIGFFPEDDGGVLAVAAPDRLYRVYARRWIWATGGYAVNLPFPDNDRPGVIAARAVGRLLVEHGILAGDKVCIVEVPGDRRRRRRARRGARRARAPRSRASRSTTSTGDARPRLGHRGRHRARQASTATSSRSPRCPRRPPRARASKAVGSCSIRARGRVPGRRRRARPHDAAERVGVRRCHRLRRARSGRGRRRARRRRTSREELIAMAGKIVLCRCEDVTLADLEHCVVARLSRHRGGQALHRLRHRPVPGQGVPRRRRARSSRGSPASRPRRSRRSRRGRRSRRRRSSCSRAIRARTGSPTRPRTSPDAGRDR